MSSKTPDALTVLLVDDHAVVREGYKRLLEQRGDIVVVGEAADATRAYELFCQLVPQVVVMDISMRGTSGIEAMRRMLARQPRTRVLIFSMHEEPIYASRALQAGACGYVTKASAPDVLVEAVHTLARGNKYLSADIAQVLALRNATADASPHEGLSIREFEILRLLVQGRPVAEIAQTMGINAKTVANYQSSIKQKLGAETSVQLLRIAGALGLEVPAAISESDLKA